MAADPICECGHPESKHDEPTLFSGRKCKQKWWAEKNADWDCKCQEFKAKE
jgi:hypothetical protein